MKINVPYDAMGQRIAKTVTNKNVTTGDKFVTTYYVRDPQGNVLAVYEKKEDAAGAGQFQLKERHLYGMNRLGMVSQNVTLAQFDNSNVTNGADPTTPQAGDTHYELTNHLGNVMAVISDKASSTAEPTVVSLSDYYPFGMTEPGRNWNADAEGYRYGFQGQDRERELWGGEASFFTFRISDNRLGRFFSVDPLSSKFPWNSSYAFSENRLIDGVEMEGLEYLNVNDEHITCFRDNGDGSYSISLGEYNFDIVQMVNVGDDKYYDLGHHMYYNDDIGWSHKGKRIEQKTEATLWGLYINFDYKTRSESGQNFSAKHYTVTETWKACKAMYNGKDRNYFDFGDMAVCHAWTMYMINKGYVNAHGTNILDCEKADSRKNKDLYYSGLVDGNRYGVAKALAEKYKVDLFDDASFWEGAAQLGDPIQKYWTDCNGGHSFIFLRYTYDKNGDIDGYEAWDKHGDLSDKKIEIKDSEHGTEIRGGNLKEKD